jgi:hypothetical protein
MTEEVLNSQKKKLKFKEYSLISEEINKATKDIEDPDQDHMKYLTLMIFLVNILIGWAVKDNLIQQFKKSLI